jgi:uncharacterized protein (DUF362 family)
VLAASANVFALDRALVEILKVDPRLMPTQRAATRLGLNDVEITYPLLMPQDLAIDGWLLPEKMMPIDFGAPRVLRSTFKHLYIRWIKEPMTAYAGR